MSPEGLTEVILAEIARPTATRVTIAVVYRNGLAACLARQQMSWVDWPRVNAALLRRYKPSGLNWIKAYAWNRNR